MIELPINALRERAIAEATPRIHAEGTTAFRLCKCLGMNGGALSYISANTARMPVAAYSIGVLRALRGLPARLRADEAEEIITTLQRWPTRSAIAAAIGLTSQQVSNLLLYRSKPSLKLWALLFPERIDCADIIESPLRSNNGEVAA